MWASCFDISSANFVLLRLPHMLSISEFVCEINFGFQLFPITLAFFLLAREFLMLVVCWQFVVRFSCQQRNILAVHLVRDERRLLFVLPRYVPPDGVIPGERSTAVGTWHTDTLVSLADVGAQVRFVAVLAITEWTL